MNSRILKKYFPFFVMPISVCYLLAFLIPFLMGIYLSFTEFTTVSNARFVGLSNYAALFSADDNFLHALGFTVLFTLVSVLTINFFAFLFALILTEGIRGTNLFRTVLFVPNLIGGIILGYIWQLIINGILIRQGVDITFSATYGFWGLVVVMNWQMIGYMMIIYIAGLTSVPVELREAASIDGAGYFTTLRHVIMPLLVPSFTICSFLTLTNSFKLFDQNFALTGGAPGRESAMVALDIFDTFYGRAGSEGLGQAKAVIFFLILAVVALVQIRLTKRLEVAP